MADNGCTVLLLQLGLDVLLNDLEFIHCFILCVLAYICMESVWGKNQNCIDTPNLMEPYFVCLHFPNLITASGKSPKLQINNISGHVTFASW